MGGWLVYQLTEFLFGQQAFLAGFATPILRNEAPTLVASYRSGDFKATKQSFGIEVFQFRFT
jgi:hypothetical protein